MNSNEKKDRSIAAVGTVIVHALIVLVLFLMAFRTPLPLPGEEGVEVDLGMMDQGMGNIQPEKPAIPMASRPEQKPSQSKEEIATQDNDEAPALEKPKTTKPKQDPKPVEQPKPTANPRAMYQGSNNPQAGGSEGIHKRAVRKASRGSLATKESLMVLQVSGNTKVTADKATGLAMT